MISDPACVALTPTLPPFAAGNGAEDQVVVALPCGTLASCLRASSQKAGIRTVKAPSSSIRS